MESLLVRKRNMVNIYDIVCFKLYSKSSSNTLTLFTPMPHFYTRENVRKPLVYGGIEI